MAEIPLTWPSGGKSDRRSRPDQDVGTTREAQNVRTLDARTGAMKGAQRPGLSQASSTPFADVEAGVANPVKAMDAVTTDRRQVTYSNLVTSTTEPPSSGELVTTESKPTPSQGTPYDIGVDLQENVYVLDGNSGVAKYTSDMQHVWTQPVERADGDHILRSLVVDPFGVCYVGATEGGKPETVRIWCLDSDPSTTIAGEDEPRLRWQIEMRDEDIFNATFGWGHVGDMALADGKLYTAQNNDDERRSYVFVYALLGGTEPIVSSSWEVAWPCHGIAVKDNGEVVTTHPDEVERGTYPKYTGSPGKAFPGLWNPEDNLTDYDKRVWSWISSHRMMPDGSDPVDIARNAQTGEERVIYCRDRSGKDRDVYADGGGAAAAGPFVVTGIHGRRAFEFRGAEGLIGFSNSVITKEQADSQRGLLPSYQGAAFAVYMVVELTPDDVLRSADARIDTLLFNANEDTGNAVPARSGAFDRAILANRFSSSAGASTSGAGRRGHLSILDDPNTDTFADAPGGAVSGYPHAAHFELSISGDYVHKDAGTVGSGAPTGGTSTEAPREPIFGVITYICDGGLDVGTNPPGHYSFFRYNGAPIDRWTSKDIQSLTQTSIGYPISGSVWQHGKFKLYDVLVLDRKDRSDDTVGAVTAPNYPDDTALSGVGWVRIDTPGTGWGAATSGALTFTGGGGSGAAGTWYSDSLGKIIRTTITSNGSNYTSQPTIGATGSGSTFTATAFMYEPTHYSPATPPLEANVTETELIEGFFAHDFGNQNKLDEGSSYVMHDETTGLVLHAPDVGLSGSISGMRHPFRTWAPIPLDKPDVNTLHDAEPITVKYGASETRPIKWILGKLWGMGRGVAALPTELDANSEPTDIQDVVTVGDRSNGVDNSGLRRLHDDGDSVQASAVITSGETTTGSGRDWARKMSETGSNNAIDSDNEYQRIAVDAYGSVYVPLSPDAANRASSVQCYSRLNAEHFEWYKNIGASNSQAAFAVAVPLDIPGKLDEDIFYNGDIAIADTHAENLYAALSPDDNTTRVAASATDNLDTINKTKLVEVAPLTPAASPREVVFLAITSGILFRYRLGTDTAWGTPTGGPTTATFNTSARFIDSAAHFGRIYITDGESIYWYDPRLEGIASKDPVVKLKAKRGKLPERPQQLYSWNSRLVAIRGTTDPSDFWMSARNEPENWDVSPTVPSAGQAVSGSLLSTGPGVVPDVVNTFVPLTSDLALFGCDSQIHMLRGDPTQGEIELVSDTIGMGFGPSWAKMPDGSVVFIDGIGDLYRYSAGGGMEALSKGRIETELRAIDWSTHYAELVWSYEEDGVRIFQVPYSPDATVVNSWFWDRRTGALWPDKAGSGSIQATATIFFDGDEGGDRVLAIGCEDGQIRKVDIDADDDDGTAIDSYVTLEAAGRAGNRTVRFREALVTLDDERAGADLEVIGTPNANKIPTRGDQSHSLTPGVNITPFPVCQSYVYARLRNVRNESWAFEEGYLTGQLAGRRGPLT